MNRSRWNKDDNLKESGSYGLLELEIKTLTEQTHSHNKCLKAISRFENYFIIKNSIYSELGI